MSRAVPRRLAIVATSAAVAVTGIFSAGAAHAARTPGSPFIPVIPTDVTSLAGQPPTSLTEISTADMKAAASRATASTTARAADRAKAWVLPTQHPTLTSRYGFRWGRLHAGLDFAMPIGTPLVSMSSGTVVFADARGGYGNLLVIRYWDGTMSYYGHTSQLKVKAGDRVTPGQLVALSGNTGHSTGPHLHLEIHPAGTPGTVAAPPAGGASVQGLKKAQGTATVAKPEQIGFGDSFNVKAVGSVDPMGWLIAHKLLPASAAATK